MKGYIVAVYEKIDDSKVLKEYAEKAGFAVKKYSGKILVRGGKSEFSSWKKGVFIVEKW